MSATELILLVLLLITGCVALHYRSNVEYWRIATQDIAEAYRLATEQIWKLKGWR